MTPNFTVAGDPKLTCSCGCGMLPDQSFMDKVQKLRELYGKPMKVSSAARCPSYNVKVSGTGERGPHTTGRAIDFAIDRDEAYDLLMLLGYARSLGIVFTGIGVHQKGDGRFLHLDDLADAPLQPRPTVWSY